MSRRLPAFQVRAATNSISRPTTTRCLHIIGMEDQNTTGSSAAGGSSTAPNASKMTPPLTTSPFPSNVSMPMTPSTPSTVSKLWNPSRGIIFVPTPMTPISPLTNPLSRGLKTRASSKASLDTPTATDPQSDIVESPTLRRTPSRPLSTDWADIMGLTPDGKEKEAVPSGFGTFQQDALEESPMGAVKALKEALEEMVEELDGDGTAAIEEEQEERLEDPGIERIKTPEGLEVITWKNKAIVYTDEKDPYIPSSYQASEEVLQAASAAKEYFDMNRYINSDKAAPTIHYVTNVDEMDKVSKLFENDKAIGFDMEWQPQKFLRPPSNDKDIRNGVSVIQIANAERVAIFHLAKYPATTKLFLAPTLKKILEDPKILKTGVWIKGDMTRLSTVINVNPAGVLELADLHSLIYAAQGNVLPKGQKLAISLTGLCEHHLKLPLFKGDVRTSSWSKPLNQEQKAYAANDAYASFKIFDALDQIRCSLDPRPALPPLASIDHVETVEAYHKKLALKARKADDSTPKKPTVIRVPKDASPRLIEAYDWIKEYAKTKADGILATGAANLRCYALWHHQKLDTEETAAACRDPPLGVPYVAQCILEAVLQEKLPYEPQRLIWVMKDVSKEAMGRFYGLKSEALLKAQEQKILETTSRFHAALENERNGRDKYGRQIKPRSRSAPPAAKLKISYHKTAPSPVSDAIRAARTSATEEPRTLIRGVGGGRGWSHFPLGDEDPKVTKLYRRSREGIEQSETTNIHESDLSTISFTGSGELGEVLKGITSETKLHYKEDDEEDSTPLLRSYRSEPNLSSKKPLWIGVPRRRKTPSDGN